MSTRVSISNLALTTLGADRITALEDNSENARRLTAIYDFCLEDILRAHPWNFAIQRQELAQLSTTPIYEYDYEYQLPSNCLRVIQCSDGTSEITDYKIEGRKLLTDGDVVYIKFIAKVEDPNQYTSQFAQLLASRLAAELAYAITNNKSTAEQITALYQQRLQTAKETDAQESNSVTTQDENLWTIDQRI